MAIAPQKKRAVLFHVLVQVALAIAFIAPCRLYAGAGPGITTQPQNQSVLTGSNAVFTVVASGQTPLLYQWSFNQINLTNSAHISGATNATLTVSNVMVNDMGSNYQVVVSNSHGSVTSSNAMLTVLVPAAVISGPTNQSVIVSNTAAFSVSVNGTAPLSYQWYFDGAPLADGGGVTGSTKTNLILSDVQTGEAGSYELVVTNNYGSATSAVAMLTVLVPAAISIQPANQTGYFGGSASFSVSAIGTAPLIYQWYFNGAPLVDNGEITGSATAVLSISDIQPANVGNYQVVVTNNYGSATSAAVSLNTTNVIHYVNIAGSNPEPPYLSWSTAATNIQDAVDAAFTGDQVMVTNGTYTFANRVTSVTTNCVVATNAISISSVSGAGQTIINGSGTNRCVYLAGGASLTGFTLMNGATIESGGGVYCESTNETIVNCVLTGNNGGVQSGTGGGAYQGTLLNCVLANNEVDNGGGAGGSVLSNCVLSANVAIYGGAIGGGAYNCTLISCLVSNNSAFIGGGVYNCVVTRCVLYGNGAIDGGGAQSSTLVDSSVLNNDGDYGGGVNGCILTNCIVTGNVAINGSTTGGGGAYDSSLYNCLVAGNRALFGGAGGAQNCVLINCTVAGSGDGVEACIMTNSIAYFTNSGSYLGTNYMSWCCAGPLTNDGKGDVIIGVNNTFSAPVLANAASGNYHLYPGSPGIDSGNNSFVPVAVDLDGNPRIVNGTVDMGCYEFQNSPFIEVQPTNQTVTAGFPVSFSVVAYGAGLTYQWQENGTNIPGATNPTYSLTSSAQYADAGTYSVLVSNSFGSLLSSNAVLTVVPPTPPAITTQPASQTIRVGTSTAFTASASGTPPLASQWYFNGAPLVDGGGISGSATTNLNLSSVQTNEAGFYQLMVTSDYGSATSMVATLTVWVPVTIATQPLSQSAVLTSNASFSAAAAGTGPLGFQWYFNGAPLTDGGGISGSATTNLNISNVQTDEAGPYVLVATNPFSSAASATATLTVLTPPVITVEPGSQTVSIGGTAVFSLTATGTAPLAYQWQENGTNLSDGGRISGSATATLTISNAQMSDIGNYGALVSNAYGTNASTAASLSVVPIIGWGDDSGYQINFPATASNAIAITARFFASLAIKSDGTVVGWGDDYWGESSPPAGLSNVVAIAMAYHDGLALQSDGTVVGWGDNSYGQTIPPAGLSNVVAISTYYEHTLALKSDGTVTGWGDNTYGQLNIPAGLSNVVAVAAGWWDSLALKNDGTVVGWGDNSLGESVPPAGLSNVVAISSGAFHSLALKSDGTVVPWGEMTDNQSALPAGLSNVVAIADSDYNCLALKQNGTVVGWGDNQFGESVAPAGLSNAVAIANGRFHSLALVPNPLVQIPPAIWWQPSIPTLLSGQSIVVNPYLTGSLPMQFQWYFNGAPLAGQTNRWLALSSIRANQSGSYELIASNAYGSITSSATTLTVLAPAQIIGQPASQAALLGANASFTVAATGSALNYQWYFNGVPLTDGGGISGSASPTLNISNVQSTDAGGYRVIVSNLLSSATSLTASLTPQVVLGPSVRYVMLASTNPQSPYLDWSTAATNIQDAVDAAVAGDSIIVSNGTYNSGSRLVYGTNAPNRVAINKPITVQSLNGPAVTTIVGFNTFAGAYFPGRCAYLMNGAFLSGFTLTHGGAGTLQTDDLIHEKSGGGIWCEGTGVVISNCIINGNSAIDGYGGGAFGGTLINCLLSTNSASSGGGAASNTLLNCTLINNSGAAGQAIQPLGGGAFDSTLSNCVLAANGSTYGGGAYGGVLFYCVLTNNTASAGGGAYSNVLYDCLLAYNLSRGSGGGAYNSTLYNCTVVTNTASAEGPGGGGVWGGFATNCIIYYNNGGNAVNSKNISYTCVFPTTGGPGDITNAPLFVNLATEDFQLQSNSPCINAGNNAFVTVSNDFDGNPRIVGGTVDMGAYEYQTPSSVISYAYLQQYGLPTDGSVDFANLDGTTFNVYQDWIAGLNPTNPASVLAMSPLVPTNNASGITVTWQSVSGINYYLQRATNLAPPAFSTIQSNIIGRAGTTSTSYTDTTATNSGPYFYRVGVQR